MSQREQKKQLTYFGVEVTRRCNLRCPHCFTDSSGQAHRGRSTEELKGLLADLVSAGAERIAFSGGEPLLRKDLEEVMYAGLEHGLKGYSMVSNGILADAKRVKSLKKAGLKSIQISIDGADVRDHCLIRACSPRAYYKAIRAIRLFREARIAVDVASILVGPNVVRGPEMLMFCEALGVRHLRYCSFYAAGRAQGGLSADHYAFDADKVDKFLEFMRSRRTGKKPPVRLVIDHGIGPWDVKGRLHCSSGEDVSYISSKGDLYPCPALIFDVFKVGNVYETPVAELLDSPVLAKARDMCRADIEEPCGSCDNENCQGGCRGAAYAAFGRIDAAPPYCNVHRRKVSLSK